MAVGFEAASAAVTVAALGTKGIGTTFLAVFAVFVLAFAVLVVVTIRWAVRRDRAGRAEWARRQAEQAAAVASIDGPGPRANGHRPRGGRRGSETGPRQPG